MYINTPYELYYFYLHIPDCAKCHFKGEKFFLEKSYERVHVKTKEQNGGKRKKIGRATSEIDRNQLTMCVV